MMLYMIHAIMNTCFVCNDSCFHRVPFCHAMRLLADTMLTMNIASYRSTPWAAQKEKDASTSTVVQVLMLSESNVCRSVLAEAIMTNQLAECGLGDMVQVESRVSVAPS